MGGQRVDQVAAELFDDFSRATLGRWIRSGELTVDGRPSKPKSRLFGGECLRLVADVAVREDWQTPQSVPFEVVYEDDQLLVVSKPAGVVVHPGAGNPDATLVNGLLAYRPALAVLPRAGIVHRLDKDTSGLMLVAASLPAHNALVKALQRREVARSYLAVTEGRMVAGQDIDKPIGRDPFARTRQSVRDDGKPALTRVRIKARYRAHTLVVAQLETGRTHQIRVHLASVGYPLVGDRRYGARGRIPLDASADLRRCIDEFRRQALHAYRLKFSHPLSGETLAFQVEPPADFQRLVMLLEQDAQSHDGGGAAR